MSFLIFLVEAALVSLSGVMAPGPITAATVGKGNESPHAGALVAVGHGIVEFPLIVCIWLGVASLDNAFLRPALGFVGGVVLLLMGIGMLRGATRDGIPSKRYAYSALGAGMILTAANPYFFVWWGTIGSWLVLQVIPFGIGGLVIFAPLGADLQGRAVFRPPLPESRLCGERAAAVAYECRVSCGRRENDLGVRRSCRERRSRSAGRTSAIAHGPTRCPWPPGPCVAIRGWAGSAERADAIS